GQALLSPRHCAPRATGPRRDREAGRPHGLLEVAMSDAPIPGGPGDMDEEARKRFLKETFGDALPEGALDGLDLSALAQQANLPQDPAQLRAAAAQMQNMFAAQSDSPVTWDMAEDIARRTAAGQTG